MELRCVYTDLDGTLLGHGASLFKDHDGNFSMMQARRAVRERTRMLPVSDRA